MSVHTIDRTQRIRELNDAFRTSFVGGAVMLSESVSSMDEDSRRALMREIRGYSTFTEGNDPHREHDFGSIDLNGQRYLWKIDYYDLALSAHSEDAADPDKTRRILTVMHSSEY